MVYCYNIVIILCCGRNYSNKAEADIPVIIFYLIWHERVKIPQDSGYLETQPSFSLTLLQRENYEKMKHNKAIIIILIRAY